MIKKIKDYSLVNWNEIFYEDESSPTRLRWKVNRPFKIRFGDVAGYVISNKRSGHQCFQVQYNKSFWLVHRILWVMRNESIDSDLEIDHLDGNSLNNSQENLRLVSRTTNLRNRKQHYNNTSGETGVHFKVMGKFTYAVADWFEINGKRRTKSFNCQKLGLLPAFAAAVACRRERIVKLNESGASYSERHGKVK